MSENAPLPGLVWFALRAGIVLAAVAMLALYLLLLSSIPSSP